MIYGHCEVYVDIKYNIMVTAHMPFPSTLYRYEYSVSRSCSNFCGLMVNLQVTLKSIALTEHVREHGNTVEPHLEDTPEMQPSVIVWTLCSVQNAISII